MTACNNNVRGGKASRVITAALVATLSVGTPMAAIASTVSEGGVDMLVATDVDNVLAGQIVEWTDQNDKAMSGTELVADGTAKYVKPTKVMPKYGDEAVSVSTSTYKFFYYVVDKKGAYTLPDGTKVSYLNDNPVSNPGLYKGVGTYYVGVAKSDAKKQDVDQMAFMKYTVVNKSLDAARITDTEGDAIDFTYRASKFEKGTDFKFMIGEDNLTDDDYSYALYYSDGTPAAEMKDAGDYIIRLTGKNKYAGDTVDIKVTVKKLDLSTANITVTSNQDALTTVPLPNAVPQSFTIDKTDLSSGTTDLDDELKVNFDASHSTESVAANGTAGAFAYSVAAKDANNKNITGVGTVIATRYENSATFKYDSNNITSHNTSAGAYLVPSGKAFDASKVAVTESTDDDAKAVDFEITYTKDGKTVSADSLTIPGNYVAKITATSDDYSFGGAAYVKFSVAATTVNSSSVYVLYNDKVVNGTIKKVYDGKNVMDDIKVTAYDKDKNEVPASELVLTYINTDTGKEVSEITDAGNYQLKVTLKDDSVYQIVGGDQTVNIKVDHVVLTAKNDGAANADWRFADAEIPGVKGSAYSYTEDSVVPTIEYNVKNDGVDEWIAVPASAYKLSYKEIVDGSVKNSDTVNSVSEVGSYRAYFADADSDDNFTLSSTWGDFSISDYKVFADVANTEWYYDEVYKAQDLKYMTGYAGTKLFGPTESLTRAQAVVVLYNMASGAGNTIAPSASYNKNNVYTTGFSDVDNDGANAWATYAIKWAKDTGITTGYGDGTFGVNDEITRAQFATMLARYAQLVKRYEAVEDADAVLGDYTDAASVDEWFKDSVAWAVSEGVMGQNVAELNPNGSIERAQVAAMAVRFQPEAL